MKTANRRLQEIERKTRFVRAGIPSPGPTPIESATTAGIGSEGRFGPTQSRDPR